MYRIAQIVPRTILNQIYFAYILPYFDYCDAIYDGHLTITDEIRLERLQNRIARLVTGAEFRTSSEKLRRDLGWDLLKTRRKKHRLILYRKLKCERAYIPEYITSIIPETRQEETGRILRNARLQSLPYNRTTSFRQAFIPNTTRLWNSLPDFFHVIPSSETFKKSITNHFSVPKPPVYYGSGTVRGNRLHTRLRLGMTCLNAHQYQILRASTPQCSCGYSSENTKHFLLQCLNYQHYRTHMIRNLTHIMQQDFSSLPISIQLDTLLHGKGLTSDEGSEVAKEVQRFLFKTGRFGC